MSKHKSAPHYHPGAPPGACSDPDDAAGTFLELASSTEQGGQLHFGEFRAYWRLVSDLCDEGTLGEQMQVKAEGGSESRCR